MGHYKNTNEKKKTLKNRVINDKRQVKSLTGKL